MDTLNQSLGSLILALRKVSCTYHEQGLSPHGNLNALSRIPVLLFECILIIDNSNVCPKYLSFDRLTVF